LGSLFDPVVSNNHAEALNEMSPIDRETVQLLMHNLSVNLANQQFRDQHSLLLEQYRTLLAKTPTENGPSNQNSGLNSSNNSPQISQQTTSYPSILVNNKSDFENRLNNNNNINTQQPQQHILHNPFLDIASTSNPAPNFQNLSLNQNRLDQDQDQDQDYDSSDDEPQIDEGEC